MVQVSLKDNESFEGLYRRFNKKYRQSNLAPHVKSKNYHEKPKTKRLQKRSALVGKKIRETKEHLQKTGQYEKYVDHRGRLKLKVNVK
ncbi:MAG: 30S ribosomal protein S21 [Patescibacteria group bacterium]